MRNAVTLGMIGLLIIAMIGMSSVALADDEPIRGADDPQVAPGEQLGGVVSVQHGEIEGEISERGFGIRIAQAASDDAKADVVAMQLADIEDRLAELEQRKIELDTARDAEEISDGSYQAKMARLEVERASTARLLSQSEEATNELPHLLLQERGIATENIEELRDRAHELGGPEVASIAQGIAGPNVGEQLPTSVDDRIPNRPGPPIDRGPADNDGAEDDDREL